VSASVWASQKYRDDDYPITDEMLSEYHDADYTRHVILPDPTAFLRNEKLNQVILVMLYTDYYRSEIDHFYADSIPDDLLKLYSEFVRINNLKADVKSKLKSLIQTAREAPPQYFRTNAGFALGKTSEEAMRVYGVPTKKEKKGDFVIFNWELHGTVSHPEKVPDNRILKNREFGFKLRIKFVQDKAVHIKMINEIP